MPQAIRHLLVTMLDPTSSVGLTHDSDPPAGTPARAPVPRPDVTVPSRYAPQRRQSLPALAAALIVQALLLVALASTTRFNPVAIVRSELATFDVIEQAPPPPAPAPQPERAPVPLDRKLPAVVSPPPLVTVPSPPPPVEVAERPTPAPQIVPPPAAPAPAPPAPIVADLMSKVIDARPPRYPVDSRRKREQGTVVLVILLDENGRVAEIGVQRSSGHRRLDDAALSAVRRWRWSPTMRNGAAVRIRGTVEIPFVLTG